MSGKKISELAKITDPSVLAGNDLVSMVDVSDVSMGPGGTNKAVTMTALIGPLMEVTPGSLAPNKAVIADSNAKIAGVGQTQLQQLNVTPGSWENGKALVVDDAGVVNTVSSTQFTALNVSPGSWTNGKVLVVDSSGKVSNVSQTQFEALNVVAGEITASKAAVWNASSILGSSTFIINAGPTATLTLQNGTTSSVVVSQSGIAITDSTASISINSSVGFEISVGTFPTRLKHERLEMSTTTNDMVLRSSFIRFDSGASYSRLGPTSLYMDANNLDINLKGLPTSDVGLPTGRVYVDSFGYLKIKL